MHIDNRRLSTLGALAVSAAFLASCDAVGISKPISTDGSCAGTTCQANKGTQTLNLTVDHTVLKVGESVPITASFGGMLLNGSGNFLPATVSDSSVLSASAFGALGLSAGTASVTVSYEYWPATLTFSVVPNDAGVSAVVHAIVSAGGATSWFPAASKVSSGGTVQFATTDNTLHQHNLVFDPAPGAPPNIAAGATATRVFGTPGTFTYSCTLHGETGAVVVAP